MRISKTSPVVTAFIVWTIFVWGVVRTRNILMDPSLRGWGEVGPLILSSSFWMPSVVLFSMDVSARFRDVEPARSLWWGISVLSCWTVVIWSWRVIDIAVLSDHPTAFIVVHTVLAASSITLAVIAFRHGWIRLGGRSVRAPQFR